MSSFDCMTEAELALWRQQTARNRADSPCVDCPLEFHRAEVEAGRCGVERRPATPPRRLEQMRLAQRRYRSRRAA